MIVSGISHKISLPYSDNIFLLFVFCLLTDIIYQSYFIERDFFDRREKNVFYYVCLILVGFFLNQEFVNEVEQVFLTGEDFRILLWALIFIFLYSFFQKNMIFTSSASTSSFSMSPNSVLSRYAKLKYQYYDDCDFEDRDVSNLIYAIMIYRDYKRSKVLRDMDYFLFRLQGNPRKLGIMQIESKKYITDSESIALTHKEIEKIMSLKTKSKARKKMNFEDVIQHYDKEHAKDIQYIFDIIRKF